LRCRHVLNPQINVIESPRFHRQLATPHPTPFVSAGSC
jgi:hypothetical protein